MVGFASKISVGDPQQSVINNKWMPTVFAKAKHPVAYTARQGYTICSRTISNAKDEDITHMYLLLPGVFSLPTDRSPSSSMQSSHLINVSVKQNNRKTHPASK